MGHPIGITRRYAYEDLIVSPFAKTANWAQQGHDAAHTGFNSAERTISKKNVAGLQLGWTYGTPANIGSMVESNGTLFIDTPKNDVYAVDESTGTQLWADPVGSGSYLGSLPSTLAVSGNQVFFDCDIDHKGHEGLCAAEVRTGTINWTFAIYMDGSPQQPVDSEPWTGPVVTGDSVIFGEGDNISYAIVGYYYSLDTKTGKINWYIGNCGDNGANDCGSPEYGGEPAAVSKGVFYYGSNGSNVSGFTSGVCAHSVASGAEIWCTHIEDPPRERHRENRRSTDAERY